MAMTIALIVISGVVSVAGGFGAALGGHRSTISNGEINGEALHKAQDLVEQAVATARIRYSSVAESTAKDGMYVKRLSIPVAYATQCAETIASAVSWTDARGRMLSVGATTTIVDVPQMLALGGACDISPPTGGWSPPATFASSNFNPGKPTGLDVLDKNVYMTADHAPYLFIASTTYAALGQSGGLFVGTGSFTAGVRLNDIRVAKINGSIYAFTAADSSVKQFRVIDVTDMNNPVLVAVRTLADVSGSFPQGFRVYYYDKRLYITTRETAGNEFHVFDVSTPAAPVELGTGYAVNRTIESMVVAKKFHSGSDHYYAYLATDKDSAELTVLDVTNPAAITEIAFADQDLPGNQDGASLYLLANRLYFGRLSGGVSELFVFDASTPWSGLRIIGQRDIGAGVIGLAVSGPFVWLATTKVSKEFQVYHSDPYDLSPVNTNFNFPNLIENGVRYSDNFMYVASQGNDALRIIYSP